MNSSINRSTKRTYDPFASGAEPGVATIELFDTARGRRFPCELWYPSRVGGRDAKAQPGSHPLIAFSHYSGAGRRASSFLCEHLAAHGYVVAALDHSEVVSNELQPATGESAQRRAQRIHEVIESRVPDLRFLLDHLLSSEQLPAHIAGDLVGAVGHSFGGWTVLEAAVQDRRIGSIVALAPAGGAHARPGILPVRASLQWQRDVPVLYLAAENDVSIPLESVMELYRRTTGTKSMVVLARADHLHFVDDVETRHEAVRTMALSPELAWLNNAMRPIGELLSGSEAHRFVRGYTLAHFDATLRGISEAIMLWKKLAESSLLRSRH
ncbi:MAG: dienelactone hydrolase family protein [Candidatus Eremiobacteraeota bacterium]|nr:dienelactone hydrolase family protein [Candidatus Eremiobacteraeota bacterium]